MSATVLIHRVLLITLIIEFCELIAVEVIDNRDVIKEVETGRVFLEDHPYRVNEEDVQADCNTHLGVFHHPLFST
jgi:hypothetical protein